jgi:hypothetical protein
MLLKKVIRKKTMQNLRIFVFAPFFKLLLKTFFVRFFLPLSTNLKAAKNSRFVIPILIFLQKENL